MAKAHFVHGFNTTDGGASTTDRLIPYFQAKWETVQHDYGWMGLLGTRFCNDNIATQVAIQTSKGDVGVGHSNGCTILAQAANKGAPFKGLILINPALDQDWVWPIQLEWVHVYYNRGDKPVLWARFRPWSPWGAMGRWGPVTTDARVKAIDCSASVNGHSDLFNHLPEWAPTIVRNAS